MQGHALSKVDSLGGARTRNQHDFAKELIMKKLMLLVVTMTTFPSWTSPVVALTTVYTDKTAWANALGGQFLTEDFNDNQLNDGITFVSTESGHISPLGYYQDVLASQSQNEPMTTWSFTPEITGFGGDWTLGGPGGSGNSLLVYIADDSTFVGSIPNSYGGEFWGFTSDTPFMSVRLIGGRGTNQQNYRLDNMVYAPLAEPLTCDFTGDGDCDGADLDLMQSLGPIAPGIPAVGSERFDLNSDGTIDLIDRDQWLTEAATVNGWASPYKLGDANLDGFVDVSDFNSWNASKFTADLLWSRGNFNADGFVDVSDFNAWNANVFTNSEGVNAVPETGAGTLVFFGLSLISLASTRRLLFLQSN